MATFLEMGKRGVWLLLLLLGTAQASDYLWTAGEAGPSPSWIRQLPPRATMLGETRFEVTLPARADLALAVTLFYREQPGGFLRVLWGEAGRETALTMNLYEGIGMESRRTLLLQVPGGTPKAVLTLQSFDATTGVSKAYFHWIEPTTVYQPPDADPIVLIDGYGDIFRHEAAAGWPEPVPQDEWKQGVAIAPLVQHAERIEDGVAFVFELPRVPELARLELEMSGRPPEWPCEVWINGLPAALLNLEVPSLTDPGYFKDEANGTWGWTGWRKGSVLIPAALLQEGNNEIILDVASATLTATLPVAVKNLSLELRYEDGTREARPVDVPAVWSAAVPASASPPTPVQLQFLLPQLELMD